MTLVFLEAILAKWLEILTQAFASISFAQEVDPIGLSLPLTSTHVITSSGWIISRYSISGGTSKASLLGAISGADFKPPYLANSFTRAESLSGRRCEMRKVSHLDLFITHSIAL